MSPFHILIPSQKSNLRDQISRGAALLCQNYELHGVISVHVQTNAHNVPELKRYRDRLKAAAQRQLYPILRSPRLEAFGQDFLAVGLFNAVTSTITQVTDIRSLEDWSGENKQSIMGASLSCFSDPASVFHVMCYQSTPLDAEKMVFLTWSGQVLIVHPDGPQDGFSVLAMDDPNLADALKDHPEALDCLSNV